MLSPQGCQSRPHLTDFLYSPARGPSTCQDALCLNATMKPGSVRKGFLDCVSCQKLSIHRLRRVSSSSHKASKQGEREIGGSVEDEGGEGWGAAGTGSLSGNSSTCHHNCMLLKSVRHRCLSSAGKLEAKQQRQLQQQQ